MKTNRRRRRLAKACATLLVGAAFLTGCGSSGGDNNFVVTGTSAVVGGVIPSPDGLITALGQISQLPSAAIPAGIIPSAPIPSGIIPSEELAQAGDERNFQVTLTSEQVLDQQGQGDSVTAEITFNTVTNALTLTSLTGGAGSLELSFDNFAGLELGATQTLSLNTPITLTAAQLTSINEGSAALSRSGTGVSLRGQILADGFNVVQMTLQPEQVVEEDGFVAAASGTSAIAFFTIDTNNAAAAPPVVVRPVGDFVINDSDVHAAGAFAGLNGANQQAGTGGGAVIALSNAADGDPNDGVWAANVPTDPRPPQTIANLNGLLAGAYNIDASNGADRSGEFIRAQITPRALQVVRMELQPEQVIEEDGFVAAAAGSSAIGFFTIDTANPAATPPVVLRPVGDFVINDADVHAAGGFAGLNGGNQQAGNGGAAVIALSNAADGDPNDGVWAANLPADPNGPQTIANLNGLLAGAYNIDASNGAGRSGEFIRAQITPGDLQVVRMELQPEQVVEEDGFVAAAAGSSAIGFFTIDTSNPAATPPVVLRPVGNFIINDADVHAAGGFAGLNGANQQAGIGGNPVIALSNAADGDPNDGVWAANLPADPNGPQTIANLNGLLAGAYNIDASDGAGRTGTFIRSQITPGSLQVVRTELQPEQVIEETGVVAAPAGSTAVSFLTLDTSDPADAPPVVLRPVGNFVINDADVNVGNAFAGRTAARQQIALANSADGDPNDGVWAANLPTDARGPQPIANLGALLAGGYYIDATDGADRTGNFIRGQIAPSGTQVFSADLIAQGQNVGRSFVTITGTNNIVVNAILTGVTGDSVNLVNAAGAVLLTLTRDTGDLFSSGAPSAVPAAFTPAEGIRVVGNFQTQ